MNIYLKDIEKNVFTLPVVLCFPIKKDNVVNGKQFQSINLKVRSEQ